MGQLPVNLTENGAYYAILLTKHPLKKNVQKSIYIQKSICTKKYMYKKVNVQKNLCTKVIYKKVNVYGTETMTEKRIYKF